MVPSRRLLVASLAFCALAALASRAPAAEPLTQEPPQSGGAAQGAAQEAAQIPDAWRGGEALLVLVTDERGQGLPGVAVTLRMGDAPDAVRGLLTDEQGRVEVAGLASGEWQVDLSREGFMLFTAYLKLDPAKDPEVAFSSRQRTGTYWAPLQAAFLRPGDSATVAASAALRTGRASAKEARRDVEQQARQEQRAEERLERRVRRGDSARIVEEEAPAPAGDPEPRPEAAPAEASPVETPSVEAPPTEVAAAEPSPGEPSPAVRPVAPAPEPVAVAAPVTSRTEPRANETRTRPSEPAPAPVTTIDPPARAPAAPAPARTEPADRPAVASPALLPNPTLRQAGACVECQPGEWSVSSSSRAAVAGACPSTGEELVDVAKLVAGGLQGSLRAYAGALVAEDSNDVMRLLDAGVAEQVRQRLGTLATPASSCVVLGLVLPEGARYVGFRYEAGERSTMGECPLSGDCQIGDASWRGQPVITREAGMTVVHAVFENRSPRRERLPRLTVYFKPPVGWLPPSGGGR